MLKEVKRLHGLAIRAQDGDIGTVDEILFDDEHWTVRYMVVDTGNWLSGRKVLITPTALGKLDWDQNVLNVDLTCDQVKNSPSVDTDLPVSRQWETDYYDHYGWPYYWAGMGLANGTGLSGSSWNPGAIFAVNAVGEAASQDVENEKASGHDPHEHDDLHLRSSHEVTGYKIVARDGHLGHVEDFIVDDATWIIGYLAVDTRDWWPGKKILLPRELVEATDWAEGTVTVNITHDQVRSAPAWHPDDQITNASEVDLSVYYAGLTQDTNEKSESLTTAGSNG